MKKVVAAGFAALAFVSFSNAQLSPLPPSSTRDGVITEAPGPNQSHWASSVLKNYELCAGNPFQTPATNQGKDVYGNTWTGHAPNRACLGRTGGTIRVIFLGEENTWNGSIGYTYNGRPDTAPYAYTIDSAQNLGFGTHVNVAMGAGVGDKFDLWTTGGNNVFCLFDGDNSSLVSPGSVKWLLNPLLVSTYLPGYGKYEDIETWIASIDEPASPGSSAATNYRLAVQFFYPEGTPVYQGDLQGAVPEPETYGFGAGLLLLIGAVARRIWPKRDDRR